MFMYPTLILLSLTFEFVAQLTRNIHNNWYQTNNNDFTIFAKGFTVLYNQSLFWKSCL